MLDKDLAELYNVATRDLNKAVKRNLKRFPDDFMFQLNDDEFKNLMFQNGTSSWGGSRKSPFAFTEQGVAMLKTFNRFQVTRKKEKVVRLVVDLRYESVKCNRS